MADIDLKKYVYDLPDEKIAQYPVVKRDLSKLLISRGNTVSTDIFRNIGRYIPSDSLMVFNNTRVIRARLLFRKESGATIEILCLEPFSPVSYELSFSSKEPVEWKCIIGNLKKWKSRLITGTFGSGDRWSLLTAEKLNQEGEAWRIRFRWDDSTITFGEVIETSGHIPLPPYITRPDNDDDANRYQTVYSKTDGSVAAPTAGLHFTNDVITALEEKGIRQASITLHIGAGTFKPVRTNVIRDHKMHCEHYYVTRETIELLIKYHGRIIAVGTTSVRTIESLYWLGVKLSCSKEKGKYDLHTAQWEPYQSNTKISVKESLGSLLEILKPPDKISLDATTGIMIVPGYEFRMTSGIITNFHLPGSTLMLLVAAWIGEKWEKVYRHALDNDFRFLSYGDSSLLFR